MTKPEFFTNRRMVHSTKYSIVADCLVGCRGTLLDVGARDRVLAKLLDPEALKYSSADLGSGHDYQLDLESKLDLPSMAFDVVVALDVLEHVENTHQAFHELARLTRRTLVIALPNMATLPRRLSFLFRANLGTDKYSLLESHQGDRHRWLTIYHEINNFVLSNARAAGLKPTCLIEQLERGRVLPRLAMAGLLPQGIMTERCIYILTRPADAR